MRGICATLLAVVLAACAPQAITPVPGATVTPTFVPLTRSAQEPTEPPLPTLVLSATASTTPTITQTATITSTPSDTPTPTRTRTDEPTATPTATSTATNTPLPSQTPLPTPTPSPTFVPLPRDTIPPQGELLFATPTDAASGSLLMFDTPTPGTPASVAEVSVFSTESATQVQVPQPGGDTPIPGAPIFTTPTPLPTSTPLPSPTPQPSPVPPRPVTSGQEVAVPIYGQGGGQPEGAAAVPAASEGRQVTNPAANFQPASVCGANAWFATDIRVETCPGNSDSTSSAAFQRFDSGYLFWLEATDRVYAFVLTDGTEPPWWASYPAVWQQTAAGCPGVCSTWTQDGTLRTALGAAVDRTELLYVARYQPGERDSIAIEDNAGNVYYGGSGGSWSLRLR
ncbi:MAG: hypothetical protein AAFR56_05015 [Chloroflexota bacterium]